MKTRVGKESRAESSTDAGPPALEEASCQESHSHKDVVSANAVGNLEADGSPHQQTPCLQAAWPRAEGPVSSPHTPVSETEITHA